MRPIKLTLEGFTSFRQRCTLDFAHLDLFAITGPTGAGKSSLLDAITFALYGKVARLGRENGSQLVSQGQNQLTVTLQFLAQDTEYRVTRSWRYRPTTPKTEYLVDKWYQDQWQRCDRSETIESILKMDFTTFTRVLLLPQGQFDEFLKGNASKRRQLLRQLLGLEVFEQMRQQASSQAKQYQAQRQTIERLLADMAIPTAEAIEQHHQQLTQLEHTLPQLQTQAHQAQQALEQAEQRLTQLQRLAELQQQWAQLNERTPTIDALKQQLQLAQKVNQLQGEWHQCQHGRQQLTAAQQALETTQAQHQQAQQHCAQHQQRYQQAQSQYSAQLAELEQQEHNLAAAQVLIQHCHQQTTEVQRAQADLTVKQQQQQQAQHDVHTIHQYWQSVHQQIQEAKAQLLTPPDPERLQRLNQVTPLLSSWEASIKATQKAQQKWQQTVEQRQKLLQQQKDEQAQLQAAQNQLQQAQHRWQQAETQNKQVLQHNHALALRTTLQEGEGCPVCGNPYPQADALPPLTTTSTLIELEPLQTEIDTLQHRVSASQHQLSGLAATLETLEQQQTETHQEWQHYDAELNAYRHQISILLAEDDWDMRQLEQQRQQLLTQESEYQQALAQQEKNLAELSQLEQKLHFSQQTLAGCQQAVTAAEQELKQRQQRLSELEQQCHHLTQGQAYQQLQQKIARQKAQLTKQHQAIESDYQQAQQHLAQVHYHLKQAQTHLETQKQQQQHLEHRWQQLLNQAELTETEVQNAQASNAQQAQWQEQIDTYQQQKIECATLLKALQAELGNDDLNHETLTRLREQQHQAAQQLQKAHEQRLQWSNWLHRATENQQQAQKLTAEQHAAQAQEEIFHTLALKLRSDAFQAYLLEHLETDLVQRATVLLHDLSEARYVLKTHAGEYWVEDNWNGGERRRIQTLSGGELFATSLAMALALSEKLSMGTFLGCLFLDEGFGSLDAESLENVIHILESLRQHDKLVGIITHIPALAERLPTQVKVRKTPQGAYLEIEAG